MSEDELTPYCVCSPEPVTNLKQERAIAAEIEQRHERYHAKL